MIGFGKQKLTFLDSTIIPLDNQQPFNLLSTKHNVSGTGDTTRKKQTRPLPSQSLHLLGSGWGGHKNTDNYSIVSPVTWVIQGTLIEQRRQPNQANFLSLPQNIQLLNVQEKFCNGQLLPLSSLRNDFLPKVRKAGWTTFPLHPPDLTLGSQGFFHTNYAFTLSLT